MKNSALTLKWGKDSIWKLIAAAVILLLPVILLGSGYLILVCCFVLIYIIAVSGLDIVFGYCGQISLGHAAFYAIGAYGSALLHNYFHIPVILTMILSAILAAAIGALLAWPASKLVFHFLSLATIAFGEIVYLLISHSPSGITGNYNGMFSDSINLFGLKINTDTKFYYFALACTVLFLVAKTFLVNSRTGRAFIAIRENVHAANGMGIDVRKYKVIAFATSAFYTAFAGAMYMHLVKYVSPETFMYNQSVLFLTMLLFGGTASLLGPMVGAFSVLILTEILRSAQDYQMFIYGILLLIVIVALPGGVYGAVRQFIQKHRNRNKGDREVGADAES